MTCLCPQILVLSGLGDLFVSQILVFLSGLGDLFVPQSLVLWSELGDLFASQILVFWSGLGDLFASQILVFLSGLGDLFVPQSLVLWSGLGDMFVPQSLVLWSELGDLFASQILVFWSVLGDLFASQNPSEFNASRFLGMVLDCACIICRHHRILINWTNPSGSLSHSVISCLVFLLFQFVILVNFVINHFISISVIRFYKNKSFLWISEKKNQLQKNFTANVKGKTLR